MKLQSPVISTRSTKEKAIDNDLIYLSNQVDSILSTPAPVELIIAVSDETTPLTAGTDKVTFRMPYAMTLTEVRASLSVAGSVSDETAIDIFESGVSILSTKITIDHGDKTSKVASTPAVISDFNLADDAEMSVDILGLTGGADEAGLKITLIGYRS